MKQSLSIIFALCIWSAFNAQNKQATLDTELLRRYTSYFTIEDNIIKGDGKEVLESIAQKSQFVVYGESHGSEQTSILNKAFIPMLADAGFRYFAIEVGPHSAQKLTELTTPFNQTIEELYEFNSTYTVAQGGQVAVPIPFFESVSDAAFLKEARQQNMQLWGIDQEFYFSAFFLMDELTKTARGNSNYDSIVALQNQAKGVMFNHFMGEFKKENEGAYKLIKEEEAVKSYFNAFDKANIKAQQVIEDMKISWDIYIDWRNDSHVDRISYMRHNFMKYYNTALKTEQLPKVYTKIGSLHAKKTFSNGAYDIGELTTSLAQKNGTIATSINSWRPFSKTADEAVVNNFEKYKKGYKRYQVFVPLAKQESWAIIDLKAIRIAIEHNEIILPHTGDYHKLRNLIYGYDYQLLLPVDEEPVPNRKN